MGVRQRISVRVKPRSSRDEIVRYDGSTGVLEVRVKAGPVDNAANEALLKLLSKTVGVPKSKIWIEKGANSRDKIVEIDDDSSVVAELASY